VGTYPLPDSQLDRFLLSFSLGYPDPAAERELLTTEDRARLLDRTTELLSPTDVRELQADCEAVHVSESLLDYVQALLKETRDERWFETGLSPRAGLALLRASRAWAYLENRGYVMPEDVKTVFPSLARHRLSPTSGFSQSPEEQIGELLEQVPIP
jgi:MoxR-like ATPase